VIDHVRVWYKTSGTAFFDVASDGTLAYLPGHLRRPERTLVRVDRHGKVEPLPGPARSYTNPVVSPDGRRIAVCVEGPDDHVWVLDLARKAWARITDEADNNNPVWSPDGRRLVVSSNRQGPRNLYRIPAAGGPFEPLTKGAGWRLPASFTPDGRSLLFVDVRTETHLDIWSVPLGGDRRPRAMVASPADETAPAVSPDGRWLAYVSSEAGREEVYVRPYAGEVAAQAVSNGGGSQPVWAKSGRELFYRIGTQMKVVPIAAGPDLRAGEARVLFETSWGTAGTVPDYDVFPDDRHFVVVRTLPEDTARSIVVIPEWFQELRARVP
jgi:serine/threonine-protein kinase